MVRIKKRDNKEIENRLLILKSNITIIPSNEGRETIRKEIEILEKYKDKSEGYLSSKLNSENKNEDMIIRWMLGLAQ